MPGAGRSKKAPAKHGAKSASAKQTSSASSAPQVSETVEDLKAIAEELKQKALKDGERLRDLFWQNLSAASKEAEGCLPTSEKAKLANGLKLQSAEETQSALEKARTLFSSNSAASISECETLVSQSLSCAHLDETMIGELYQIRGKIHYQKKSYMLAIRDLTMAKNLFFEKDGETTFYRMRSYLDLHLPNYATLDYDFLAENFSEFPNLKSFKSKVTSPMPHDFQKLLRNLESGKKLPPGTSALDLAKLTIVIALAQDFGFEELGQFLFMMKKAGYKSIASPLLFGTYLRDVFAATDLEDVSEVFTHFIPEHDTPMECTIHEVVGAVNVLGEGCHLVHQIGYAMCFSLAWTPASMWNLHATLFGQHLNAKSDYQRALWHEYFADEKDRILTSDDDVSYFANGGIGEIPPPHARIDYLYVTDHGASDYVRLHAVAHAHLQASSAMGLKINEDNADKIASEPLAARRLANAKLASEAIAEMERHVPLNTFHVTLAPMIFAVARDAMPHALRFMIERGAEVNVMDAAEETPLEAARVALEFRMEMLHDHGYIVPIEAFAEVQQILKENGAKELHHHQHHHDEDEGFDPRDFFGGFGDDDEEDHDNDDDDDHDDDEDDY